MIKILKPQQRRLVFAAPALVVFIFLMARVIGHYYEGLHAFLLVMGLYWSSVLFITAFSWNVSLSHLYSNAFTRNPLVWLVTWIPPVAALLVILAQQPLQLAPGIWALVLTTALINGIIEEMFWRGTFVTNFLANMRLAWLYPTLLFTLWHGALLQLPGIQFQGGAVALMGGALIMGLVWGGVVWRTHDLRLVTLAHIVANTIAFAGLARDNGLGI